jgi:thioredoxin
MQRYLAFLILFNSLFFYECSNRQSKPASPNLSPKLFAEWSTRYSDAPILDVRTEQEFSDGHLDKALNINWNGADFKNQIEKFDKLKPVFVYCLSGGRSAAAANAMRSIGFKEVYEMEGGMMKWRASKLPEVTTNANNSSKGMSNEDYEKLLQSDKLVLIDFYAEWCQPCKKMKPFLEEISKEMEAKVKIVRIDADAHSLVCKTQHIETLPTLILYKNGKVIWKEIGFVSKEDILAKLK